MKAKNRKKDQERKMRAQAYSDHQRRAAEQAYFTERLEDVSLLDRAVDVGLLAVPVGGIRRSGYVSLGTIEDCEAAVTALSGVEGFPNPRITDEEYGVAEWGDEPEREQRPGESEYEFEARVGRTYGYTQEAIDRFASERGLAKH